MELPTKTPAETLPDQKLNLACSCTVLLPSPAPATPKSELGELVPSGFTDPTVVSMDVALIFVLLNRLKASTRNSNFASSPRTGSFGKPNALVNVPSRSL